MKLFVGIVRRHRLDFNRARRVAFSRGQADNLATQFGGRLAVGDDQGVGFPDFCDVLRRTMVIVFMGNEDDIGLGRGSLQPEGVEIEGGAIYHQAKGVVAQPGKISGNAVDHRVSSKKRQCGHRSRRLPGGNNLFPADCLR